VSRLNLAFKALRELGPRKLGLYAWYKLLLRSGYFRNVGSGQCSVDSGQLTHTLNLPMPEEVSATLGDNGIAHLVSRADEIVNGLVRLFGGEPVPLNLTPPGELSHWTEYELGRMKVRESDIKFVWEPARFGWAFTLGRAYHLTKDERYPETFWRYFEIFQEANPVNLGPNWISAQEVALRLIAFAFASQIFSDSPHVASRTSHLLTAIVQHAARIPSSIIYARAQNNNHLLSEAAGLITASMTLPDHPESSRWSKLGWKWFNHGLISQIAEDGSYMQQSTNYHRLMLQLAVWVHALPRAKERLSQRANSNLQLATRWLFSLIDKESGCAPNLGPNDGAYIFPLTGLPYHDYRPVLQTACQAFLNESAFEPGVWDQMSLWFVPRSHDLSFNPSPNSGQAVQPANVTATLYSSKSWAYLRAAKFHDRPGHADQLHLDLWWRGLNIARDAGTYLYNADPPWDNPLTHTAVHNTVMVDNLEQMTPAGRFLYLDRAQAEIVSHERAEDSAWEQITATHDGYRHLGIIHQRAVTAYQDNHWIVEDQILPTLRTSHSALHTARLHWLLPDWEWKADSFGLKFELLSPHGWIRLEIQSPISNHLSSIVRAGEVLYGELPAYPTWGWVSPTYGVKTPALSISICADGTLPLVFSSQWIFPPDE